MLITITFCSADRSQLTLLLYTVNTVSFHETVYVDIGPVVRFAPHRVDVQHPEIATDAWGGHNDSKLPWDKDPTLCRMLRFGMKGDNLVSTQNARAGLRLRRLMGPPFARKFLLDQESIFKNCTKRMIERLTQLRAIADDAVDMATEFKKFTLDVTSKIPFADEIDDSRVCVWRVFQGRLEFHLWR
jgi:cytochrome P450